MKTKTIIELLTLSSSLYMLSKDTEMMEKLKEMVEKGKDRVNKAMATPQTDEEGNELEFLDKLIIKAAEAKAELEERIEKAVAEFYHKANIAHTDEIRALNERLAEAEKTIALLEAKVNKQG